jgi:beta-glucanase (GH16 family)
MRLKLSIQPIWLWILLLFNSCSAQEKLVFSDEFEGDELNMEYWSFALGNGCPEICGWGNNEPQIYTKNNHKIEDGQLVIRVNKEKNGHYTSTRILTKDKFEFQYGRVEARIKLPQGKGVWPAFWMLGSNIDEVGWPKCGEVDIMEYVGREPGRIFSSLHTKSSHGNTINTYKTLVEGIEDSFHVYAVDWTKNKMDFYLDGKKLYTYAPIEKNEENWPFDQSFYMLLNVAVGGNFGGPAIDDAIFPQEYLIDYIRVYEN